MLEHVGAVGEDLARRRVERDREVVAGRVARRLDARHERLERGLVGLEVGREAALVADAAAEPAVVQVLLEVVERLGAHPQRVAEPGRADRDDHELLEVDRVVGVRAAVEHVHHRDRQDPRRLAAEVAPERLALLRRGGPCGRQRDAEDRVGAQAALVRRAVELDQRGVEAGLVERVAAGDRLRDLAVDVPDRLQHPLAEVGVAAVAQLGRLELAGRGAGRHRGAALRARAERELHLDGRVPARVEDLAGVDGLDLAQGFTAPGGCLLGEAVARVVRELVLGTEIVPVAAVRCGEVLRGLDAVAEAVRRRRGAPARGRP